MLYKKTGLNMSEYVDPDAENIYLFTLLPRYLGINWTSTSEAMAKTTPIKKGRRKLIIHNAPPITGKMTADI